MLEYWEFMLVKSSQEQLSLFFSFFFLSFFFFSRVVSSEKNNLSNHFYSTLEGEERGKGREKSPFAVLIALPCLREALFSLSKLTQPGPCAPGSA